MSNKFELNRTETGIKIFIKSNKLEQFFKELAQSASTTDETFRTKLWFHNERTAKYLNTINAYFQQLVNTELQTDVNAVWPSFRQNSIFHGNEVSVRYLSAVGISEGKTFELTGSFSKDTATKIGKAYQKAMNYLINEAFKTITIKFEVIERSDANGAETTVLEFDQP